MDDRDRDRDRDADADSPDPTRDSWSAWLPQLDGPPNHTSPGPAPTPLPQASGPPPRTEQVPNAAPSLPPAPPQPYAATPPWAGAHRVGPPPTTYFGWAVLCAIACFTPFGIVAIVKALQVKPRWFQGDWDGAAKASRAAKRWCLVAAATWPGSVLLFSCLGALSGGHMSMHL